MLIQVTQDPKCPAKKKETCVNGLAKTHGIRVQTISIYLQTMAWTFWTFVRKTWVICNLHCGIKNFGRSIWLDIGPTQSNLWILARKFVQTRLGAPAIDLFLLLYTWKYVYIGSIMFPTETPDHYWPFRRPVVGGHTFSPLLSPVLRYRSWTRNWLCHPLALLCLWQSDTKYQVPGTCCVTFE